MTAPASFKQIDLTRAVRGLSAAGKEVQRIEIAPDGKIIIIVGSDHSNDNEGDSGWEDA